MMEAAAMGREALLKITALFSYCGGPLFIADLLKPRLGTGPPFWITFLPVGVMVIGACYLDDLIPDRWSSFAVRAGRQCLYIVLGTHGYAVWCFAHGTRVPDQSLHYIGILVGVVWSAYYLLAARRWESRARGSSPQGGPPTPEPIEPS